MDSWQEIPKNKEKKTTKKEFKESTDRVVKDITMMMRTRAICPIEEMMTKFSTHPNKGKETERMTTMNLVLSNSQPIEEMEEILIKNGIIGRK